MPWYFTQVVVYIQQLYVCMYVCVYIYIVQYFLLLNSPQKPVIPIVVDGNFVLLVVQAKILIPPFLSILHPIQTSLAGQWLRLCASIAGGTGSIPAQGNKIPHAMRHSKRKKEKKIF